MDLTFIKYKDFKQVLEDIEVYDSFINEESTAPTTTTDGVAEPSPKPLGVSSFMGYKCYTVDCESYSKLMQGKTPFKRWSGYIEDETMRTAIQKDYYKNKKLLIKNAKTDAMIFVK